MWQEVIQNPWYIGLAVLWTLPWKAVALWRSARRGEHWWFMVLLVVNTLAVLDILYIFVFSRKPKTPAVPGSAM